MIETADWKKHAAATLDQGEDIEKAFLDQAYGQIAIKAQPIMKSPYRVGFEIVNKNDTNTRMAGIFIFRINKELLFAPVFFINGNIKGTDLLYRHTPKRFVPLTNDWTDYLLGVHSQDEGQEIPRNQRSKSRNDLDLHQIVHPPSLFGHQGGGGYGSRKYASFAGQLSPEDRAKWDEFTKNATEIPAMKEGSILKRFIVEAGGLSAINKLVATCNNQVKFAQAMMLGSRVENYMPDLPPPTFVPGPRDLLVFHSSVLNNKNVKQASLKGPDMCRGWMIEDFRKEAEVNPAIVEDPIPTLHTINEPGVYEVLSSDGSMRPMVFAYEQNHEDRIPNFCGSPYAVMYPSSAYGQNRVLVAIDIQTRNSATIENHQVKNLFGRMTEGDPTKSPEALDVGSMQTGKAYRIYNSRDQTLSSPFIVKEAKTDGIKRFEISNGYSDSSFLLYNPDYDKADVTEQLVGNCCKAFEVETHEDDKDGCGPCGPHARFGDKIPFGGKTQLEEFIFGEGYGRGTIKKASATTYAFKMVGSGQLFTRPMSKIAATAYLMSRCHVRQDCAEEMLKKADAIPEGYSFFYQPLEKTATMGANMRFNDWPDFEQRTNNEFGVLEEPYSEHLLQVEQDRPDIIRSRIGDRWDQGTGEDAGQIDTATPLELYSQSQEKGIGSMFDHGVEWQ